EGNAMIALVKAPNAQSLFALFNFHLGGTQSSDTQPDANGESLRFVADSNAIVETGPGGGAMVYVALSGLTGYDCAAAYGKLTMGQDYGMNGSCAGNDIVPGFQFKPGADGWWAVAMQFVEDASQADNAAKALKAWGNNRTPDAILSDAQKEWEAW